MNTLIKSSLGRTGFIRFPLSDYKPSLRKGKAGSQGGNHEETESQNQRDMLLAGWFFGFCLPSYGRQPGHPTQEMVLPTQGWALLHQLRLSNQGNPSRNVHRPT